MIYKVLSVGQFDQLTRYRISKDDAPGQFFTLSSGNLSNPAVILRRPHTIINIGWSLRRHRNAFRDWRPRLFCKSDQQRKAQEGSSAFIDHGWKGNWTGSAWFLTFFECFFKICFNLRVLILMWIQPRLFMMFYVILCLWIVSRNFVTILSLATYFVSILTTFYTFCLGELKKTSSRRNSVP